MIASIVKYKLPEVILMDINMPEMDGYEATQWLKENHPEIKVLALSMYDNDNAIIRMLKAGEGFPFLVQFKSRHFSLVNGFADGRSEAKA